MPPDSRDVLVLAQYRDGTNLAARQELYHRFGTARRPWQAWVFDHLRLPDRTRVLEVGCGRGSLWVENRDRIPPGWRVTLSDFSPGMVVEARAGLRALPDFHFVVAELSQLPFPEGSFDAVIANHMLFHVPNLELGLAEIHRVLGRGGVLIAATNGPEHLLELRQLQARIGTQAGARTHVDTAFDLATGPSLLNPLFGRLTVSWHPEELRITDPETVVAYLRSLPGPRLSSRHAGAARESVAKEIEREGAWKVAVEAGLIRGRRRSRVRPPQISL